ncbi:YggT family protein [Thermoflavimicrobium dichotomicum]|uniref:YggT family protein/cell division inhibitor SepF n=1 Tax=Thermoflavimicrobium dichotomicum TaxID=46223 RepID=A0A1I3V686_9BACL|nr:YggT family protein [Thermoflavimicrobium dichotomicum]SFJ91084.1 YggT family protein/cell division inhibitor SepF [Thermoflavimicrobium dichotomicum]
MTALVTINAILNWASYIYQILIVIYVFMSWLPNVKDSSIGFLLARICEPYLSVFRRIIPPIGFIDLSPILAIIALPFLVDGLQIVIQYIVGVFI